MNLQAIQLLPLAQPHLLSMFRTAIRQPLRSLSTMSNPEFVYKIFPAASVDTRFAFPIPIPASHEFFLTEVDLKDGFVHMATAAQVPGVLKRFFGDVDAVTLLRIEYGKLSAFKRVRWDRASDGLDYPHLYAHLEGENIESFKELERGQDWDAALQAVSNWLV